MPNTIGNHEFGKDLCDSSASLKSESFFTSKRLSLGELTPTIMSLEMENRSMTQPGGILEDVLVKAEKFIFLV